MQPLITWNTYHRAGVHDLCKQNPGIVAFMDDKHWCYLLRHPGNQVLFMHMTSRRKPEPAYYEADGVYTRAPAGERSNPKLGYTITALHDTKDAWMIETYEARTITLLKRVKNWWLLRRTSKADRGDPGLDDF